MKTVAIAILVAFLGACGTKTPAGPPARPPVPVVTATAEVRDMPLRVSAIGIASASELVTVRPQISAILTAVRFTEGDAVAAGAPLFSLDERAFRASEQQATAELDRARAEFDLAETEAARIADMLRQKLASAQQEDQVQANLAVARAAMAAAAAALERVRIDLAWCTVTAPIAGRTGAVGVTAGNFATAGQSALVTIARMQPMHVGFSLPASMLPALRAARAKGALAVAAIPDGGGAAEPGTVDLLDNQVDVTTATIRLRAACPNPDERLWPGQQCRIELTLGTDLQVVTVPEQAVQNGQRGTMVWVVATDLSVAARQVVVGRTVDGVAIITSGLAAGDTVVTDGQLRLSKGATVTKAEAAGTAAKAIVKPETAGKPAGQAPR